LNNHSGALALAAAGTLFQLRHFRHIPRMLKRISTFLFRQDALVLFLRQTFLTEPREVVLPVDDSLLTKTLALSPCPNATFAPSLGQN